ncbi:formate dehydrogenase accessory protein FdhE domain-containing protein [Nonomuraea rubra]|uniref:formate dehydrogenase accessory protein FdhE domain-containing protein n=1 Tax=Nonomuraea rubra TaxID=46180 RepID=UPI0033CB6172
MYGHERARALELRERYPHAREVLGLYLALVDVWESADPGGGRADGGSAPSSGAGEDRGAAPGGDAWLEWAAAVVLPRVMAATAAHGPRPLAEAVGGAAAGDGAGLLAAWVAGEELTPVERFLARATMRVVPIERRPEGGAGRCPACGGPPQLSYRLASEDPLVSGRRMLACATCPHEWSFSATTCPNCGESGKRTVHAEAHANPPAASPEAGSASRTGPYVGRHGPVPEAMFPQLRAESCESCHRYLIDVDLGRDPGAVPRVDELAAVPVDLYMAEQGHTKITANLMGF